MHITEDGTGEFHSMGYHAETWSHQDESHHDEEYDSFEPARLGGPPAFDAVKAYRNRSMTVDSQVSAAESRYGGFDLVDEEGRDKVRQDKDCRPHIYAALSMPYLCRIHNFFRPMRSIYITTRWLM